MIRTLWGKKIGMTQVFSDNHKVVPVTVIDVTPWLVTQIKNKEKDGYDALVVGLVKKKYAQESFSPEWLKEADRYFSLRREVQVATPQDGVVVGAPIDGSLFFVDTPSLDITGTTIGRGFQGGVKRHGFTGGLASHGSKLGRKPGSIGGMRSRGRVIKGTRMAGHMGVDTCSIHNLQVIKYDAAAHIVLVKGSVPGKTGSLLQLSKRNR